MAKGKCSRRFGIAEWYGRSFADLCAEERRRLAVMRNPREEACPYQSTGNEIVACTKKGGVCTIRLYELDRKKGFAVPAKGEEENLCTMCPNRFLEDGLIHRWVGEVILNRADPLVIGQVGFLESEKGGEPRGVAQKDDVGKIDNVLVSPTLPPLNWCPVEIQAVYFSGSSMQREFDAISKASGEGTPFPVATRRPDYRSSGPKRLMPQLQIKVPSLRRWGRKMAVVVDVKFFNALGRMDDVGDISNADIAWFGAKYEQAGKGFKIRRGFVRYTTLERAVEGLTAGLPVSQTTFEKRILEKVIRKYPTLAPRLNPDR